MPLPPPATLSTYRSPFVALLSTSGVKVKVGLPVRKPASPRSALLYLLGSIPNVLPRSPFGWHPPKPTYLFSGSSAHMVFLVLCYNLPFPHGQLCWKIPRDPLSSFSL